MSKSIETLVPDIYKTVQEGVDKLDEGTLDEALKSLKGTLKYRLEKEGRLQQTPGLRMSNVGTPCKRKLWYQIHHKDKAEQLRPNVLIKFLYGDLLEWLFLFLSRIAGHKVEGEQDTLEVAGVIGHRDAIIDGRVVDVKSANARGFDKFKEHKVPFDDPFGYMDQLSLYHYASASLDDKASFLAIDKEMGHVVLDTYTIPKQDWPKKLEELRKEVEDPQKVPPRAYAPIPHQKSGNMQLDLPCRYCDFKKLCYPETRTFLYSSGPIHLTTVSKRPEVDEIT